MLQKLEFDLTNDDQLKQGIVTLHNEDGYNYLLTNPTHEYWKTVFGEKNVEKEPLLVFIVKELESGIYLGGLNFEYDISGYTDYEAVGSYDRLGKDGLTYRYDPNNNMLDYFNNTVECYGVADNIEQIKEHYKDQIESSNPIVISVTEIKKATQPEEGGWRWHKWGQYIGTKEAQCEYIKDEPEIDSVFVYHVYSVQPKLQLNLDNNDSKKMKL